MSAALVSTVAWRVNEDYTHSNQHAIYIEIKDESSSKKNSRADEDTIHTALKPDMFLDGVTRESRINYSIDDGSLLCYYAQKATDPQ